MCADSKWQKPSVSTPSSEMESLCEEKITGLWLWSLFGQELSGSLVVTELLHRLAGSHHHHLKLRAELTQMGFGGGQKSQARQRKRAICHFKERKLPQCQPLGLWRQCVMHSCGKGGLLLSQLLLGSCRLNSSLSGFSLETPGKMLQCPTRRVTSVPMPNGWLK